MNRMSKEGRFYVEFLGWKETRGLYGASFTDPVVSALIERQQKSQNHIRMSIKVNEDELQVTQHVTTSQGKSQKIKYPKVLMCDISYVTQCAPPHTDIVSCIFLGYNPMTKHAAHVHVYRFDSSDTATIFLRRITSVIEQKEYRERILAMERDLIDLGHLRRRDSLGSDGASNGSSSCHSPNSIDSGYGHSSKRSSGGANHSLLKPVGAQTAAAFSSIHNELEHKLSLQNKNEKPILLPPKDYDTVVRRHGHISIRAKLKPFKPTVVGAESIFNNNQPKGVERQPSRSSQVAVH